ncbi:MAG: penicillin-binding protein 2 [Proteobacteria bacterium]|nr:penicillin-binding protein 2 [Pseudomonadota bacterium]
MRDQITRSRGFTRRTMVLVTGKLMLTSILASRLYYLQVMKSSTYKTLSDENRIRLRPVVPLRGRIMDRNGEPMAENDQQFRAIIDPAEAGNLKKAFKKIADVLELEETQSNKLLHKLTTQQIPGYFVVKEHLSWDEVSRVEVNMPDLPGVLVDTSQIRSYPLGTYGSHLLGYIAAPSKKEVEKNPILNQGDFKVGKSGIEYQLENELRGKIGVKRVEVDVHGVSVRELSLEESVPGDDMRLTVDARLQRYAAQRIQNEGGVKESGGTVVVLDIRNGDVLTLVSSPGYDPNVFARGVTGDEWRELVNHPDKPLSNKAISMQYPPGSTFKLITSLAGLKEGVDPHATAFCPGYYEFGGRRFRCWNEDGHGTVNMQEALAKSCNVFFYKLAQRIGVEAISAMAHKMGLGQKEGIELFGEKSGVIPDRAWKMKTYNKPWNPGETLNTGIGQGYVLVTPLQLAVLGARVATGKQIKPRLVREWANKPVEPKAPKNTSATDGDNHDIKELVNADATPTKPPVQEEAESLGIPEAHLDIVRGGMDMVINKPLGTAFISRIIIPQYAMAGKTGTAQVRSGWMEKGAVVERKYRNHALFVGFAPVNNPRYACSVVIEHGESGSRAAAPVARDVLTEAQRLNVAYEDDPA